MVRRLVFFLFVIILLVGTAVGVYTLVPLVGDLSKKSLGHSVAREFEGKGDLKKASCRNRGKRRFTCRVPGEPGKLAGIYRVKMDDRRCYTARRASLGPGKRRKRGCVGLRDQLRLGLFEKIL